MDQLAQQIQELRQRVARLQQTAPSQRQELLPETLDQLRFAIDELQAVEAQLCQRSERASTLEAPEYDSAQLHALAEASRAFVETSLDLPVVLNTIAQHIAELIGDVCVIRLLSEDRQRLELASFHHRDPEARAFLSTLLANVPIRVVDGVQGQVAQTGQPLLLPVVDPAIYRAALRPDYEPYIDRFGVYSIMCVPLRVQGQVIGTLLLTRDTSGQPYTASDLTFLQELATRAAPLVNHARLYQEINSQREQLQVTLASIGDAVIVADRAGCVTFLNSVAQTLTGWSQHEALGKPLGEIFRIVNEDTREAVESPVVKVIRDGAIVGLANHTLLLTRDGTERPIDDSGAPIRDNRGTIIGVVLVFRDISERKHAEDLLARYQLLSEHARDIILFIREDGRIVEANSAAVKAYGYDREELLVMNIFDLREPDTKGQIDSQMQRADTTGILFETTHQRKNGETFQVEVSSRGAVIGRERLLLSIIRDISERKHAEATQRFLAEASTVLASSLDYEVTLQSVARLAVPAIADWCAVDVLAEDGTIQRLAFTHVDPAKIAWAHELQRRYPSDPSASYGVSQVIRSRQPELYSEITDEMLVAGARDAEHLQRMREIGFTSSMTVPLLARDATLGAITFVSAESGRRYGPDDLAFAEQLAHRAALAVDNARLYREARAAVRARDQFLSIASHELKTPLTSLLGYAQLFQRRTQREGALNERDQRALRVIVEQAERLNKMVKALLDLSRIETGQLRIERAAVDLVALANRVLEEVWMTTDQHTLQFSSQEQPLIVEGDELRLEQVLQNLLGNAIKYSPAGGIIRVQIVRDGAVASLSVSDQGIGIPHEVLPNLFQRFYRAPNVDPQHISGMGIGLYVVKEIVVLHGGTVEVSSTEGQGSTFTISLPLHLDAENEPVAPLAAVNQASDSPA